MCRHRSPRLVTVLAGAVIAAHGKGGDFRSVPAELSFASVLHRFFTLPVLQTNHYS